jgi:hypothetical protein
MIQAVTDIKELVGEMPVRGCQCGIRGCNRVKHHHGCTSQAVWAVKVHGKNSFKHGDFVMALCDQCLQTAKAIKATIGNCGTCGAAWSMGVMPL